MGTQSHEHKAKESKQPLTHDQEAQEKNSLPEHESPANAAHHALNAPEMLAPSQVRALQRTVGNRAVQRTLAQVQRGTGGATTAIQRHRMGIAGLHLEGGTLSSFPEVAWIGYNEEQTEEEGR